MKRYISLLLAAVILLGMMPAIGASAEDAGLISPVKETFESVQLQEGSADSVAGIIAHKAASVKVAPGREGNALWLGDPSETTVPEVYYSFASTDRLTLEFDIYATGTNDLGTLRFYNGSLTNANTALWLNFNYQGLRYHDNDWSSFVTDAVTTANTWIKVRIELTTGAGGGAKVYFDDVLKLTAPAPTTIGANAGTISGVYFQATNATKNFYIDNLKLASSPVKETFEDAEVGTVPGLPFVDVNMATVQNKTNAASGSIKAVYLVDSVTNQTAELRYPIADTTALVAEFDVYAVSSVVAFRITNGARTAANSAFWMRISGANVQYNTGSGWQTLKTLDASIVGRWVNVRIEANLEKATIFIDGVDVGEAQRTTGTYGTAATTAIDSLAIACGDNTYASYKFYVDNIRVVPADPSATVETFDGVALTGQANTLGGYKSGRNVVVTADPADKGNKALYLSDTADTSSPYFDYTFGASDKLTLKYDYYVPNKSTTTTYQIYNGSKSNTNTLFYLQFNYAYGLRVYDGSAYTVINSSVKLEENKWYEITMQITAGADAQAMIYVDGILVATTDVVCGSQVDTVTNFYMITGSGAQKCYIDDLEALPAVDITWVVDGVKTVSAYYANTVPEFGGTPEKACDALQHYIFTGWDQELVAAAEAVTYTAQFAAEAHTMSQWQQTVAPGLYGEGVQVRSCLCGYGEEAAVPAMTVDGIVTAREGAYLEKDVSLENLVVDAGKTLDLNGFALEAERLICFGSIIDTSDGSKGVLLAENAIFSDMDYMPVCDKKNGWYKFYDYELKSLGVRANGDGSVTYGVAIDFTNADAYRLLASEGSGVDVTMELEWGDSGKVFAFDPIFVQRYAQLQQEHPGLRSAMMLTVTGLNMLSSGTELTAIPSAAAAGLSATGKLMSYINEYDIPTEEESMPARAVVSAEASKLGLGETTRVTLDAVYDTNANAVYGYSVQWRSQTPSIATVDESGSVTAVRVGTAKLYAVVTCGGKIVVSNEVSLEVCDRAVPFDINATASATALHPGKTGKVTAVAYNCFGQEITGVEWKFESLTPGLLTVDAEGNYTAVAAGTAQLLVTVMGGEASVSRKLTVTVYPEWDTDGDGVLSVLTIGNSFSIDAMQYAYEIARDLGVERVVLGNLYVGSCTLQIHANNARDDIGAYTYYYNDSGVWGTTANYKMSTALESRSWDFVSLQQGSGVSGVEETYNGDLDELIAYVQERSDAKLVWHMTWAYQQDSTHGSFPTYNSDQLTMYNAIVSCVQNKIVPNKNFDRIIPNGTAVQNSRTSNLGDTTTRDGYHMSYLYGRYLTGLLLVKTLTGLDVDSITYMPFGMTAEEKAIAIESVKNAAATPFGVTQSAYTGE